MTVTGPLIDEPCPLPTCTGVLYLNVERCFFLYRIDGDMLTSSDLTTSAWKVTCTEGHTVQTHVDQIKVDNLNGRTEDDETTDNPPKFRPGAAWWT